MSAQLIPLSIDGIAIRQDAEGRYCLNDLHKAAGSASKDQPAKWLILDQTKALIAEIEADAGNLVSEQNQPLKVHKGGDGWQGTFVCKELVYAYAMWISPKFNLKVIRTFDAVAVGQRAALPAPGWLVPQVRFPVARLDYRGRAVHVGFHDGGPLLFADDALAVLTPPGGRDPDDYRSPRKGLAALGLEDRDLESFPMKRFINAWHMGAGIVGQAFGVSGKERHLNFVNFRGLLKIHRIDPAFYAWYFDASAEPLRALPALFAVPTGAAVAGGAA